MEVMHPSSSPSSSPLGHRSKNTSGKWQLYQPNHSSPLSSTQRAQSRRKAQFKSQERGRVASASVTTDDSPQKRFLRDRFKAQCLERAKENRAKAIQIGRDRADGSMSSDGFDMDGDSAMGDEDGDIFDDDVRRLCFMPSLVLADLRRS